MKKKIFIGLASLLYGALCVAGGWLAGIDSGFDTGYRVAYLEMESLLRQGISEKVGFCISGLNIRFSPRKDGKLVVTR